MHVKAEARPSAHFLKRRPCCHNTTTTRMEASASMTTIRSMSDLSRRVPSCTVQFLPTPKLQQRPQYNGLASCKDNGNDKNKDNATTIDVLRLMDGLRLPIEADMYVSLLKGCTHSRDAVQGAMVHAHILRNHAKHRKRKDTRRKSIRSSRSHFPVDIANRLLLMYTACDSIHDAWKVFDQMPVRDASSWATMISAASHMGNDRSALELFVDMLHCQHHGWFDLAMEPAHTLSILVSAGLKSCVQAGEVRLGEQLHGVAFKIAMTDMWFTSLLQFFVKFGCLTIAQKLFDSAPLSSRCATTSACTCLVVAYCRHYQLQEAFQVFSEIFDAKMQRKMKDDSTAFSSILSACARIGVKHIFCGRQVHATAVKMGLNLDPYVGTSLLNMYGKFGLLEDARKAFDAVCSSSSKDNDSALWNAMLISYVHNRSFVDAIRFLYQMKSSGIEPHESIISELRIACGS